MKNYQNCIRSFVKAACASRARVFFALILMLSLPVASIANGTSNGITGLADAEFRAGLWWDPARDGSGWEINVGGDVFFGIWYTYNEDGSPTWYTTNGSLSDGHYEGDLLSFSWDYINKKVTAPTIAGRVTIDFLNQQLAEIQWQLDEHQYHRTLRPFIFEATPTLSDYSGSWFDPQESGYGMTIQTQGDVTYAVLYYYDDAGNPTWSAGINEEDGKSLSLENFNGSCPWCEYRVPDHAPAGDLLPQYHSETALTLEMSLPGAEPSWSKSQAQHVMISNPPSGRAHPAAMASIASKEALAYYFRAGHLAGNGNYYTSIYCVPIVSPPPPSTSPPSSEILSTTNVQVEGVDEADVVKATKEYLYSLDYPKQDIPRSEDGSESLQSITRYTISANGDAPVGDGVFPVSLPLKTGLNSYVQSQGLYHFAQSSDSEPEQLIYLASQLGGQCGTAVDRSTFIRAFDLGSGTDFIADRQLEIEGELVASRRIGDRLFVATTYRSDIYSLAARILDPDVLQNFSFTESGIKELFDLAEPEQLTPSITYTDGHSQPLVTFDNILMPPLTHYDIEPVLTTLSMFDLNNLDSSPVSIAIMGKTDGIYATPENVYFASSGKRPLFDDNGHIYGYETDNMDIHKIAISRDTMEYRGSGTIEGTLGWDSERLSFRMSEYQDHLRIVSSGAQPNWWGEGIDHRLTVLKESGGDDLLLQTVAVLPNEQRPEPIGKPGEAIHGVRFHGDRGYVVTFQRIDPLYALDLSVPADPRVLGELEIEGFSDYLHPVGDDLLIGIGMQAVFEEETRVLWLQGMQVGLFDVSEPMAPMLLSLQEVGQRGTTTTVLESHRAFTFVPGDPDTGRPMRFVIPVSEHGPVDDILDSDPGHWYPWRATGVLMYEVQERPAELSSLDLVGRADVANIGTIGPELEYFYQYSDEEYSRSVLYGDQVFHYFRGGLFKTNWAGGEFTPADNCSLCTPWGQ